MEEKTLIIVPTFNEAQNIPALYVGIRRYAAEKDILFVDDSSGDATPQIIDGIIKNDPHAQILKRPKKEGIGRAYISGFLWGLDKGYAWFQEMDADLSHDPAYLPEFEKYKDKNEVIIASRYVKGGRIRKFGFFRRVLSFLGCLYLKLVLRCPVQDLTGGFNCWSRKVIAGLDMARIVSRGFLFQAELKFMAYKKGFKIVEFPFEFRERERGRSKIDRRIILEGLFMPLRIVLGNK